MMGTEVWLSSQSRLPGVLPPFAGADKLEHAVWFFLLGLLAYRAGTDGEGWSRPKTIVTLVLAAALWGASDEWHQSFVPGRSVEAADVAADVAGTGVAVLVAEPVLRRLRQGR